LICIENTTDCISSVQTQTIFCVNLFVCKSLVVVLEHRKVSCLSAWALEISCLCAWVLVIWYYIVNEIFLEVQGGHDYFRFVKGTCIIALCLSSLSLTLFFIRCTLSLWSLLQKLIISCFWTVTSVGETKKKKTQFNPLSCVFPTFNKHMSNKYFIMTFFFAKHTSHLFGFTFNLSFSNSPSFLFSSSYHPLFSNKFLKHWKQKWL